MNKFKRLIKSAIAPKAKIELSVFDGTLKIYFFYTDVEHIKPAIRFAEDYCLDSNASESKNYFRITVPPAKLETFLEALG